jgi:Tc5 transposase DNA-binding domain
MSSTIDEAVDYTLSKPTALIKPTARAFDVAPRTLSRRLNGGLTRQEGHSSQQILSASQEKMLVNWILEQERLGHASTHQRIREFAAKIRDCSGEDPHIGKHWLTRFQLFVLKWGGRSTIGEFKIPNRRFWSPGFISSRPL